MDRRLGRPLPHQLPNPTRADPLAINLSPEGHIRYYSQFPGAIPYQRARSHALLTRPPLTPKDSLDLHVLSLPPAFVLSQDQTLKLKGRYQPILDVRTSAHRSLLRRDQSLFDVLRSPKRRNLPNSEADTRIIGRTLARRYAVSDPSNEPNRPHISSDTSDVKERRDKFNRKRRNLLGAPACIVPSFLVASGAPPLPLPTVRVAAVVR